MYHKTVSGSARTGGSTRGFSVRPLTLGTALLLAAAGCGSGTYEERLAQTSEFFEYLHTVDSNLAAPAWDRRDLGMAMRVPLPFSRPLPGPERHKDEEGNEFLGPETRHPDVLGIDLPGLEEAWQAPLTDDAGEPIDARFYILTNHDRIRMKDEGGPPPADFLYDLDNLLMNAFGVTIPDGEAPQPADNVRFRHVVPARGSVHAKYTTSKDYSAIRFVPSEPVAGRRLQGLLFKRESGPVQAAILVIAPQGLTSQFRQRMDLSLQTLQISAQLPTGGTAPGGAPRPGGSGGGF